MASETGGTRSAGITGSRATMRQEDRLADLFRRYAEAVRTGTESEALEIRKKIREERERIEKK